MVPEGEDWTMFISNRTFKSRVIERIIMDLPGMLLRKFPDKEVIIDYDTPIKYHWDKALNSLQTEVVKGMQPLGEADIKSCRWCDLYPNILIDSIDGDSIPILLAYYNRKAREADAAGTDNKLKISIYRMQLQTSDAKREQKTRQQEESKKRKMGDEVESKKATHRTYEFVNIPLLYVGLQMAVLQCTGKTRIKSHEGYEMDMLLALVVLTGTDFTRNLPQVTGAFVWENLNALWLPLCMAYDVHTKQLRETSAINGLISSIYSQKFAKHVAHAEKGNYERVTLCIQQSALSSKTKAMLPSSDRVRVTCRNCNWVLEYWQCNSDRTPSPWNVEKYGYARVNDKTAYADEIGTVV
jgi:hypothetical protein